MTPDYFKRIDTTKIYPPLQKKIEQLLVNCSARGVDYYAISGYRSPEEQDGLYAQGRTKPGNIVTKAKGGQSAHNFGVAEDCCKDKDRVRENGLQPDWDLTQYEVLAEEAEKLGLEPGYRWKFQDADHVQLPLHKYGITFDQLYALYKQGGQPEVWKFLDQYSW
jgi:peptidoglycan L-alanyl-D-glutamate endopeptidase CwlK